MIEASFGRDRSALASGAYQYDTGQRLRIHGLPSPQELAREDDFLSGDVATVQVHFGIKEDSQTEARLALWDEQESCYLAAIPDAYLQKSESVYAYVYVSYGLDEDGNGRTKTMYELTFRPIARPAPNNVVTDDQWEAWASKKEELELTLDTLGTATAGLETAISDTEAAALAASQGAKSAYDAQCEAEAAAALFEAQGTRWEGMTVRTASLSAGAEATVTLTQNVLTYGLPRGATGAKGDTGDTGPADIALSLTDGVLKITPK